MAKKDVFALCALLIMLSINFSYMTNQQSVEEYLEQFPPQIRECAEELRVLISEVVPDYTEKVYHGWKLIGYRVKKGSKSFYFAFIYPAANKVVLGFEFGVLLPDPHNLLVGNGNQVRQIVFKKKVILKRCRSRL